MDVLADRGLWALSATAISLRLLLPAAAAREKADRSLRGLQLTFLPAQLLALMADWLQGPYNYRLYTYHGIEEKDIALLFLTGQETHICMFAISIGIA